MKQAFPDLSSQTQFKSIFLRLLTVSLLAAALLGISIFLFGEFGDLEIRVLVTTLTIGGFSLTGLCCATIYGTKQLRLLSIIGMIVSLFGFLINVIGIWELWDSDWTWRIMADFIILSVAFAHISLLLRLDLQKQLIRTIRTATISCICVVAGMLIWAIFNEFENSDFYFRLLGVFAILDALGTILIPVLNKVSNHN